MSPELSEDGHVEGQTGQAEKSQARDCASARSPEPVALFCETSHSKIMVRRRLLAELGARPCKGLKTGDGRKSAHSFALL